MFKSGRLLDAIAQMAEVLKSDPWAGRMSPRQDMEINIKLVTIAMEEWKW